MVGIIAILLAFLFFPLGLLLGIVAAVLGFLGRKKADRGEATNKGQATAGLVLGILSVVIAIFVGSFFAENADEFGNLTECNEAADTDAERDACAEDFEQQLD